MDKLRAGLAWYGRLWEGRWFTKVAVYSFVFGAGLEWVFYSTGYYAAIIKTAPKSGMVLEIGEGIERAKREYFRKLEETETEDDRNQREIERIFSSAQKTIAERNKYLNSVNDNNNDSDNNNTS
eukprot:TRINITY_DN1412_c0_g1_i1.p1 TRINITY_DN1412_c0_g1~~TRINITY_DN1412_c0_g1_i1.p1  ORF type:complete len:124 (-),score=29.80 TRINITY_DN1412_c0_g1_i1:35-406(-)